MPKLYKKLVSIDTIKPGDVVFKESFIGGDVEGIVSKDLLDVYIFEDYCKKIPIDSFVTENEEIYLLVRYKNREVFFQGKMRKCRTRKNMRKMAEYFHQEKDCNSFVSFDDYGSFVNYCIFIKRVKVKTFSTKIKEFKSLIFSKDIIKFMKFLIFLVIFLILLLFLIFSFKIMFNTDFFYSYSWEMFYSSFTNFVKIS